MGFFDSLGDWVTRNVSNPIQDLVAWDGDTGRVDRANGKDYGKNGKSGGGGSQDQDVSQVTDQTSGGDQSASTGDTTTHMDPTQNAGSSGGGVSSGGASNGSNISNVEETNTVSNQNTVSPVTEVEVSNQSQSNAQGSQSQSIQSQAQKANSYMGGGIAVSPVITADLGDEQASLSTWQLALLAGGALAAVYLLKPAEEATSHGHK